MRIPALLLAATLTATPALAMDAPRTPEARLAHMLEGRTPGAPVDCITQRDIRSSQIFEGIGIVYEGLGGTYYLNRAEGGATMMHRDDVLVTDTHSSQLCSIDIVRLYDNGTRMQNGFVSLGKFIPYPRPPRAR